MRIFSVHLTLGRLSRGAYWGYVACFLVAKAVLAQELGGVEALAFSLTGAYFLLSARLHDFGAQSWFTLVLVSSALVPGAVMAAALAISLEAGDSLPSFATAIARYPALLMATIFLELLFFLMVGIVPGDAGHNAFGPPGQGPLGIFPRIRKHTETTHVADPADNRIERILSERQALRRH
jgi:uncharacterized membrane protein YhaH (DUF805 family)